MSFLQSLLYDVAKVGNWFGLCKFFANFFLFFLLNAVWCVSLRGLTTAQSRGHYVCDPFCCSTAASTGTSNRRRPRHRWGCLHCKEVEKFSTPTAGGIGGVNLPKHRPPHRIGGGGGSDGGNVGAFSAHFRAFFREGVILYLYRRKTAKTG